MPKKQKHAIIYHILKYNINLTQNKTQSNNSESNKIPTKYNELILLNLNTYTSSNNIISTFPYNNNLITTCHGTLQGANTN